MKKLVLLFSVVVLIAVLSANVFAGGGKVRGEEGEGFVNQYQEMDPPPFEDLD